MYFHLLIAIHQITYFVPEFLPKYGAPGSLVSYEIRFANLGVARIFERR